MDKKIARITVAIKIILKFLFTITSDSFFISKLKKILILKIDNLNPINAVTIPPRISVKKCASTTTLLNETTNAKKKKKYFSFGAAKMHASATAKIVEVCPEGKEWKLESKVKKLKKISLSKEAALGLERPTRCFKICVIIPEYKTDKNKTIFK